MYITKKEWAVLEFCYFPENGFDGVYNDTNKTSFRAVYYIFHEHELNLATIFFSCSIIILLWLHYGLHGHFWVLHGHHGNNANAVYNLS